MIFQHYFVFMCRFFSLHCLFLTFNEFLKVKTINRGGAPSNFLVKFLIFYLHSPFSTLFLCEFIAQYFNAIRTLCCFCFIFFFAKNQLTEQQCAHTKPMVSNLPKQIEQRNEVLVLFQIFFLKKKRNDFICKNMLNSCGTSAQNLRTGQKQ